ncbi:hypothetical protein P7C70_g7936, partial [Phenoliferia sp. Uapishka_3]
PPDPAPPPPAPKIRKPRPLPPPRPKSTRPTRPPSRYDSPTASSSAKSPRLMRILVARKTGKAIPKSWNQAMASDTSDKWIAASTKELENLGEKKVVRPVRPPPGANILNTIWVYDLKKDDVGDPVVDEDGRTGGQKMRAVADGRGHIEGVNYEKLASATAQATSIRLVMGYAAEEIHREKLRGVTTSTVVFRVADFKGAYLSAGIDRKVYIRIPKSADPELEKLRLEGWVWEVLQALYGLCQSAGLWGICRDRLFRRCGFKLLKSDGGVYIKRDGTHWLKVPSHVNDLLGAMNAIRLWDTMVVELERVVTFSKVGNLSHHLGATWCQNELGKMMCHLAGYTANSFYP